MLIHRISPHDVAAIKNVYERVWLMTVIEEEEKKKRAGKDSHSIEEKKVPFGKKHSAGLLFIQTNTHMPLLLLKSCITTRT